MISRRLLASLTQIIHCESFWHTKEFSNDEDYPYIVVKNAFYRAKATNPTASPPIMTCRDAEILGTSPLEGPVPDPVPDPLDVADVAVSVDVAVVLADVAVGPAVIVTAKNVIWFWFKVFVSVRKLKPLVEIISVQTADVLPPVEQVTCPSPALPWIVRTSQSITYLWANLRDIWRFHWPLNCGWTFGIEKTRVHSTIRRVGAGWTGDAICCCFWFLVFVESLAHIMSRSIEVGMLVITNRLDDRAD